MHTTLAPLPHRLLGEFTALAVVPYVDGDFQLTKSTSKKNACDLNCLVAICGCIKKRKALPHEKENVFSNEKGT